MSMKADFNLVVGAERALSYEAMREDLNDIIGKLNKHPYKVKLRFDMASASKDVNKLRSDLKDLSQKAADIKFSDRISNSLSGITASLKTLTDSITGVAGLKEELLSLSEAMRSFQGINLNIGLSGGSASQRSAAYGVAARDTIAQLRERATQMEQLFAKYYGMNDRINAVMNSFRGTNILEGRDIFSILGNKDNTSLSYTKQMDALREYINLLERAAAAKNIDFSSVSNSFNASANEVVSSTQKILTGEQQIESGAEKIRSIFGSGINSEALISKLEEIRLSIDKITESLTNLNTKEIKLHFDETELNEIKTQIAQLLAEMSSVTSKGEASKKKKQEAEATRQAAQESKLAYDDATRAIKNYYKALNDLRTIKGSSEITLEANGWHSENAELQGLVTTLNNTKAAYDLVVSAMKNMPLEQQAKLQQLLTSESTKYAIAVEKQAAAERASAEAAAKKKQEAEATRQAAAIKATNNERVKEAEYNIRHYAALRKLAAATNKDIIPESNGSGDFEWASKSGVYKELAHQMNEARVAYQNTIQEINAGKFSEKDAANLTKRRADEAANLALQLEKQREASRPAADSEKAQNAVRLSSLRTYNRATKVLDGYRHVLKGHNESSKEAYRALEAQTKALDEARNNYDGTADSAKKLHEAENAVKVETENVNRVFAQNNEQVNSLGGRIKGLATKFASWLGVSQVIMYAVRAIKQMVSSAKEIDYAMTQLKIVTNATDAEMRQFANTAITLAKDLGKSVTELTKSIETFSRLGYSLKDASELAKYATIMSNVAGVSNEEATTGLTSIVKGFNLDVSDAEHVADILIDVGQKYAVSAGEMMEAYEKSGAALSATNTSLEKSAGLIAAANASVQDASVIGTALKTVSARIRGSKSDLEELGENTEDLAEGFSKYADEIKALTGFDIMIDDTHFKDLYDIMEGISGVWDKLSDTQQARVAEILGGTRQLQVISSIIGNWKDAAGAYETAINSAGASSRANAVYMENITAHIDQMKASFEELSTNVMNSGFTKFIVDTGKTILEILNGITKGVGSLGTILIGGAIYKGFKSIA